jgi:hypothetical protein
MNVVRRRDRGQVLAFFALVLPIVMLPAVAYSVDVAMLGTGAAGLQAAVAQAVEVAAQQIDVGTLRAGGGLELDPAQAAKIASDMLIAAEPQAVVDSVNVAGWSVTLAASEPVLLAIPLWTRAVTLHAHASARLVPGYESPSSL